jgi:hypothetical protein
MNGAERDALARRALENEQRPLTHRSYVEQAVSLLVHAHSELVTRNPDRVSVRDALLSAQKRKRATAAEQVLDTRRALGADDESYLSTGIGLVWASEPDKYDDDSLELYPSSDASAQRQLGPAVGMVAQVDDEMRGRIDRARDTFAALTRHLVALLSIDGVGEYAQKQLRGAGYTEDSALAEALRELLRDANAASTERRVLKAAELERLVLDAVRRASVAAPADGEDAVKALRALLDGLCNLYGRNASSAEGASVGAMELVKFFVEDLPLTVALRCKADAHSQLATSYLAEKFGFVYGERDLLQGEAAKAAVAGATEEATAALRVLSVSTPAAPLSTAIDMFPADAATQPEFEALLKASGCDAARAHEAEVIKHFDQTAEGRSTLDSNQRSAEAARQGEGLSLMPAKRRVQYVCHARSARATALIGAPGATDPDAQREARVAVCIAMGAAAFDSFGKLTSTYAARSRLFDRLQAPQALAGRSLQRAKDALAPASVGAQAQHAVMARLVHAMRAQALASARADEPLELRGAAWLPLQQAAEQDETLEPGMPAAVQHATKDGLETSEVLCRVFLLEYLKSSCKTDAAFNEAALLGDFGRAGSSDLAATADAAAAIRAACSLKMHEQLAQLPNSKMTHALVQRSYLGALRLRTDPLRAERVALRVTVSGGTSAEAKAWLIDTQKPVNAGLSPAAVNGGFDNGRWKFYLENTPNGPCGCLVVAHTAESANTLQALVEKLELFFDGALVADNPSKFFVLKNDNTAQTVVTSQPLRSQVVKADSDGRLAYKVPLSTPSGSTQFTGMQYDREGRQLPLAANVFNEHYDIFDDHLVVYPLTVRCKTTSDFQTDVENNPETPSFLRVCVVGRWPFFVRDLDALEQLASTTGMKSAKDYERAARCTCHSLLMYGSNVVPPDSPNREPGFELLVRVRGVDKKAQMGDVRKRLARILGVAHKNVELYQPPTLGDDAKRVDDLGPVLEAATRGPPITVGGYNAPVAFVSVLLKAAQSYDAPSSGKDVARVSVNAIKSSQRIERMGNANWQVHPNDRTPESERWGYENDLGAPSGSPPGNELVPGNNNAVALDTQHALLFTVRAVFVPKAPSEADSSGVLAPLLRVRFDAGLVDPSRAMSVIPSEPPLPDKLYNATFENLVRAEATDYMDKPAQALRVRARAIASARIGQERRQSAHLWNRSAANIAMLVEQVATAINGALHNKEVIDSRTIARQSREWLCAAVLALRSGDHNEFARWLEQHRVPDSNPRRPFAWMTRALQVPRLMQHVAALARAEATPLRDTWAASGHGDALLPVGPPGVEDADNLWKTEVETIHRHMQSVYGADSESDPAKMWDRSSTLPSWFTAERVRDMLHLLRHECAQIQSAMNWGANREEVREQLARKSENRGPVKRPERHRRASLWSDALREIAISNDRLYIFLRTLAGTLHEQVDAVIEVNDSSVQQAQDQERARRADVLRRANDFSNRVMEAVFKNALKSAKLDFGVSGEEVVVMSSSAVDDVRRLAEGESGLGYFEAAQRLQNAISGEQGFSLTRLVENVSAVLRELRETQLASLDEGGEGTRTSFEYLSAPRNSFTVRLKAEASAAIKTAWAAFCVEWRQHTGGFVRQPRAWELIEGPDNVLRTTFATYCAYTLSHSRIFSSSSSVYVSKTSSQMNFALMRITLVKLIRRASEYVQANPVAPNANVGHAAGSAHERNPWGAHSAGAIPTPLEAMRVPTPNFLYTPGGW